MCAQAENSAIRWATLHVILAALSLAFMQSAHSAELSAWFAQEVWGPSSGLKSGWQLSIYQAFPASDRVRTVFEGYHSAPVLKEGEVHLLQKEGYALGALVLLDKNPRRAILHTFAPTPMTRVLNLPADWISADASQSKTTPAILIALKDGRIARVDHKGVQSVEQPWKARSGKIASENLIALADSPEGQLAILTEKTVYLPGVRIGLGQYSNRGARIPSELLYDGDEVVLGWSDGLIQAFDRSGKLVRKSKEPDLNYLLRKEGTRLLAVKKLSLVLLNQDGSTQDIVPGLAGLSPPSSSSSNFGMLAVSNDQSLEEVSKQPTPETLKQKQDLEYAAAYPELAEYIRDPAALYKLDYLELPKVLQTLIPIAPESVLEFIGLRLLPSRLEFMTAELVETYLKAIFPGFQERAPTFEETLQSDDAEKPTQDPRDSRLSEWSTPILANGQTRVKIDQYSFDQQFVDEFLLSSKVWAQSELAGDLARFLVSDQSLDPDERIDWARIFLRSNAFQGNKSYEKLISLYFNADPEMSLLSELSQKWTKQPERGQLIWQEALANAFNHNIPHEFLWLLIESLALKRNPPNYLVAITDSFLKWMTRDTELTTFQDLIELFKFPYFSNGKRALKYARFIVEIRLFKERSYPAPSQYNDLLVNRLLAQSSWKSNAPLRKLCEGDPSWDCLKAKLGCETSFNP